MTKIRTDFYSEIKKYGANDFQACYNCGNCTAVCSLTEKNVVFPRSMIRYGMLGLKEDILKSRELWLCYSCGDCSETCPRQADPGQYMAALRRYAISAYEPTGITRMLFKSNLFAVVFTLLLAVVLGFFLFTLKPNEVIDRWIFNWMPFEIIHDLGMLIFGFAGLSMVAGLLSMIRNISSDKTDKKDKKTPFLKSVKMVMDELVNLKRYQSCDKEEDSYWKDKPQWKQPWFIHWSIMWGFIGLLVATTLDFLFKDPATTIWWPSRILGTVAGLFLVYGTTVAISYRRKKVTKAYSDTSLADWTLLWFLWIAGITGFWLEIAVAFAADNPFTHLIFLIHTIISMEMVILFIFSKFAHAVYRPLALYFYFRDKK